MQIPVLILQKIYWDKLLEDITYLISQGSDITLIFGPLYHLYTERDAKKAIDEAIRVTKKRWKNIKE